jgi:hypothetical protein
MENASETKLLDRLKRLDAQNRKQENKLLAATRRLKILEAQRRELDDYLRQRSHWISVAMLGCVGAYLVFSKLAKSRVMSNEV